MPAAITIPIGAAQQQIEQVPIAPLQLPSEGDRFDLQQSVIDSFPICGSKVVQAVRYAHSIGSSTAKLEVLLPGSETVYYFLKIVTGLAAKSKCEGEYEALKAIHTVSPGFITKAHAWGLVKESDVDAWFLLEDMIELQQQPADAVRLAEGLADLHQRSKSSTGKFGFHVKTWHGNVEQNIDQWDESWAALFHRHLQHIMEMAKPRMNTSSFDVLCESVLYNVIPRLLLPLQEAGRELKPSLIHGDCWDGNTAINARTGEACVFDVCSFYGHNEYDTGNWRAPRHRVSNEAYMKAYKHRIPPSEPVEDWSARQLLYSLPFNIGNLINIPGSRQGQVVYEDMLTLCKMFCPRDLEKLLPYEP